jgi:hypothetical protein
VARSGLHRALAPDRTSRGKALAKFKDRAVAREKSPWCTTRKPSTGGDARDGRSGDLRRPISKIFTHTGKDDSKGARGHSLLKAAVDTEIEVRRHDGVKGGGIVSVTKQRDLETGAGFAFKLVEVELGVNARQKPIKSCVVEATTVRPVLTESEEQAMEVLNTLLIESDGTVVRMAEWQKAVLGDEGFMAGKGADTRSRTFRRARKNLKSKGYIETSATSVWTKKR